MVEGNIYRKRDHVIEIWLGKRQHGFLQLFPSTNPSKKGRLLAVPAVPSLNCIASLGGDPEHIQSPTCFLEFRSSLGMPRFLDCGHAMTPLTPAMQHPEAFEGCWSAERAQRQRKGPWIAMDYHGIAGIADEVIPAFCPGFCPGFWVSHGIPLTKPRHQVAACWGHWRRSLWPAIEGVLTNDVRECVGIQIYECNLG